MRTSRAMARRRSSRRTTATMATDVLIRACAVPLCIALVCRASAADVELIGAGASFPAPAIEAWAQQFSQESGVRTLRVLFLGRRCSTQRKTLQPQTQ